VKRKNKKKQIHWGSPHFECDQAIVSAHKITTSIKKTPAILDGQPFKVMSPSVRQLTLISPVDLMQQ
jgi:hypothetical protein